MSSNPVLLAAIMNDDATGVEAELRANPQWLEAGNFSTDEGHGGYPLNIAAYYNACQVIELLVNTFHADVNRQKGVGANWTPLHHACTKDARNAIQCLLELGADPTLRDSGNKLPADMCNQPVNKQLLQDAIDHLRDPTADQEKEGGLWLLSSPHEVTSHRRLPDNSYRLTDIFNFESRRVISIAKDLQTGQLAQSTQCFDDLSDKQILHAAHAELIGLGGTADAAVIDRAPLQGKKLSGGGLP